MYRSGNLCVVIVDRDDEVRSSICVLIGCRTARGTGGYGAAEEPRTGTKSLGEEFKHANQARQVLLASPATGAELGPEKSFGR